MRLQLPQCCAPSHWHCPLRTRPSTSQPPIILRDPRLRIGRPHLIHSLFISEVGRETPVPLRLESRKTLRESFADRGVKIDTFMNSSNGESVCSNRQMGDDLRSFSDITGVNLEPNRARLQAAPQSRGAFRTVVH